MTERHWRERLTDIYSVWRAEPAYTDGWNAKLADTPRKENPYPVHSTPRMAWWLGWDECHTDALKRQLGGYKL